MADAYERVVIVSDLHLGAGPDLNACGSFWDDRFDSDQEFEEFASWLIETGASRVVLLGDTIDFHRGNGLAGRGPVGSTASLRGRAGAGIATGTVDGVILPTE